MLDAGNLTRDQIAWQLVYVSERSAYELKSSFWEERIWGHVFNPGLLLLSLDKNKEKETQKRLRV